MILIGMFDSPFVRRVAISMRLLGFGFEHRNWSVGKDFDRIREFNPLGRVPTLVLDDGEALTESAAILDHLDQLAGPERALLPASGTARRKSLHLMALATGAAEKGVLQIYERAFRPEDKVHQPWLDRCYLQMTKALRALETACAERAGHTSLAGERFGQADITVAIVYTFLSETRGLTPDQFPALHAHTARCETRPEFVETHIPFFVPAGT